MDIKARNNVKVCGHGDRTLVMAHGFGCDQTMWRHLVPAFSGRYRIVLFDYVGSGHSDLRAYGRHRYSTLDGYVKDLLEVMADLDLHDAIFVGHSVSAMIGAIASIQQPERFSELLMIAPSPHYLNDPPDYAGGFELEDVKALLNMMDRNDAGWVDYMAPTVMKNPARPALAGELAERFCAMDPGIARRFAEVTFLSDTRHILSKITTPTLLLQCRDDAIAPLAVGDYLARHIPGAVLRVMNATGHCPHLSHPEETITAIRDYLALSLANPTTCP